LLEVLKFNSSLFGGVLDNGEDKIFMGTDKFKQFMQSVETVARKDGSVQMNVMEQTTPDEIEVTEERINPLTPFNKRGG